MSSEGPQEQGPRVQPAQTALDTLVELLDLEEIEVNIFRGYNPKEDRPRVFGGQVAAQALVAAGRTVPEDRCVHSLHSYFLRPGDMDVPIVYFVDRIRDGRSFTTRRVVAIQHGEAIFNMAASYQKPEPGVRHRAAMPDVPRPEETITSLERWTAIFGEKVAERMLSHRRPVEIRYCDPPDWRPAPGQAPCSNVWIRANGKLPDDPKIHTAVLTYASDYTLTDCVMRPHGVHWMQEGVMTASLDHAMWFHEPLRADEWWLYAQDSPATGGARGLARGTIFAHDGRLACSVAQEVLLRTPALE
ncbi:MAG: acyl-CoA thioesterase II [Myxococcales bacterium]|nr:MAG: acyl-CoA thioesterase II [Myxococcales bacterium]